MNILIWLLLLILILLSLKLKISIGIALRSLDVFFRVKILWFSKKGKLVLTSHKNKVVKTKKKEKTKKKNTKSQMLQKESIKFLQYVEIEKLDIHTQIGLLLLFPTIFSVPIMATLLDSIKWVPFKKIKNFHYQVLPEYDKLTFHIAVDTVIKIRILDILKIAFQMMISRQKTKKIKG